ncbi:MAG: hypothetical protein ACTSPY_05245 [Candidatus Helarchaeota archaeon]
MKTRYYYAVCFIILGIFLSNITIGNTLPMKNGVGGPTITHIPIKYANTGYDLLISCDVVYSGTFIVQLMIRKPGVWQYNATNMTLGFGNTYYTIFPANNLSSAGIEYYIKVYVNENLTVTYPYENASDNPFRVIVRTYTLDVSPTIIYMGIIFVLVFAVLYAVDIIDIKNPWGGKKNE